ncbi:MAG: ATP-binding cassette domain-containing protein [Bacteroidetes bacterium]|nr:ATP-binding cassette domain-containing protein [Bacteroidota bacterium]MBT3750768.1 ATP-binding cassette domain-containing protein [Bacteroidota bacterium]MBT4398959.1 ATP-binding cassette domain-containing protein [Bacteroidota bacterium]MBT4409610.1 ATP-binding cassette domain-containing protein [Bacteroidota bacterium]MBT7095179.1 ATP-binding cassette domain-containing protein [Bacteroidota bacterium]
MISRKSVILILALSALALIAGFESAIFTRFLYQSEFNYFHLILFAGICRVSNWSIRPISLIADQIIERDSYRNLFNRCTNWSLKAIRQAVFHADVAKLIEQNEKIRYIIIGKIIPGVSAMTVAISLFFILSIYQPLHLPLILILVVLEIVSQSIQVKCKHKNDLEIIESERKFHYLKQQLFSPIILREHRICRSIPAIIEKSIYQLSNNQRTKRKHYGQIQMIKSLIRCAQVICLIFCINALDLLPINSHESGFSPASLGSLFAAFKLIRSGSQLGSLPAILLEIRLCNITIKTFDQNWDTSENHSLCLNTTLPSNIDTNKGITAVTGPNGSGKSTLLLDLAERFSNDPAKKSTGILFQNFALLQASIVNNIVLYKSCDIRHDDIDRALHASGFKEIMTKYCWNLDTEIGEEIGRGRGISLGEWQKLALARALYHGQDYLILDEPDAHLDTASKKLFENEISRLKMKSRLIIASHSEQLIKKADYVIRI